MLPPAEIAELQWGRDIAAADTPLPYRKLIQVDTLQWGRDIAAADTRPSVSTLSVGSRLQWGRDIAAADTETFLFRVLGVKCFNGAATLLPRIRRLRSAEI